MSVGVSPRRIAAVAVAATALAFTSFVGGTCGCTTPSFPSDVAANIWVDTTGGSCADLTSLVTYQNDGSECGSLNAALQAAEPGDKIAIRTGRYGGETLARKPSLEDLSPGCDPYGEWGAASTTNCVTIVNDGDVRFASLVNNASSIWVKGEVTNNCIACGTLAAFRARSYSFHISNEDTIGNPPPGADDDANCNCKSAQFRPGQAADSTEATAPDHIIWDGIDTDTAGLYSSKYVMLRGMDIGPMWFDTSVRGSSSGAGPDVVRIWSSGSPAVLPDHITWDGNFVHEMNRTYWCSVGNVCHPDGLYIKSAQNTIIRNSAFSQVAGQQVFFEDFDGTPDLTNFLMENTWIGCVVNGYVTEGNPGVPNNIQACGTAESIDIKNCGTTCNGMLFRFNSWYGITGAETSYTNTRFVGNTGRQPGSTLGMCAGATWTYNAFTTVGGGSNCGATNVNTGSSVFTSLFQNPLTPGSEDFRLAGTAGSTVADNLVPTSASDSSLATDFQGQARPQGSARDAGVDER